LTHRPSAHNARPWETSKTETIDVMDAVGCAIRVDARGREVMRIMPRNNDAVNEEWISDKARHVADGLKTQRLDQPYVRRDGRLQPASWDEALSLAAGRLNEATAAKIGAIAGDLAGAEEMFALNDLMQRMDVASVDCRAPGEALDPRLGRSGYIFNSTIAGIDTADAILLIGTNPRLEAAVLNGRIRKRWRQGGVSIGVIGAAVDLTYGCEVVGAGAEALVAVADGTHPFAAKLASAKRPMIIVGQDGVRRSDSVVILALAARIATTLTAAQETGWKAFNVLHSAAARVAGLDLGLVPRAGGRDTAGMLDAAKSGQLDVVYLLGVDEIDPISLGKAFVIYQGSHGDVGAARADIVLPGAAYTEKSATYVNLEGRAQQSARSVFPPGEAREDWTILRALSSRLGATLPYDTLPQLRAAMYKVAPQLARVGMISPAADDAVAQLSSLGGMLDTTPFTSPIRDFYLTNPIARSSAVMAELSQLKAGSAGLRTAAE
jgi:NADH-quinone oxidoreductase subunit G